MWCTAEQGDKGAHCCMIPTTKGQQRLSSCRHRSGRLARPNHCTINFPSTHKQALCTGHGQAGRQSEMVVEEKTKLGRRRSDGDLVVDSCC